MGIPLENAEKQGGGAFGGGRRGTAAARPSSRIPAGRLLSGKKIEKNEKRS